MGSAERAYAPEALRGLLRRARERIARAGVGGLPELRLAAGLSAAPRTGRRDRGLTQYDMDVLLGRPPGAWYSRFERGMIANPAGPDLHRLAEVLGLDATTWDALWKCLYGRPPTAPEGLLGVAQAPPIWYSVVTSSPLPAYVVDEGFDVLWHSPAADELWGGCPHNTVLSVLAADARVRENVLVDWPYWCLTAVSQLAGALRERPAHRRLLQIRDIALLDPQVRAVWDRQAASPTLFSGGGRRLMRHAGTGRVGAVSCAVAVLEGVVGYRVEFLRWTQI
ncbi:hypothetical protein POF50_028520 [Streptomyces sp. SL13]|uniref:MmyB-like transcription regulator ligand binding domain-containing protein n=1 Tax=Streptantibioticus silvisoli TaxID=2705255 RepID=A0AA90KIK0_9ACTN|nr:hypothetical protein [Streptantibioticus silvisoli]MDI5973245.1 hypothetical protein [Streptantibioticus silvisoli]